MFYHEFRWFDWEFSTVRTLIWIRKFLRFYVTSRFSCFNELLVLRGGGLTPPPKNALKSWSLLFWFIFKEFAPVPRVTFPTCYCKTKCQNIFQLLALGRIPPHPSLCLPLLCIVISIYNGLHLAPLQFFFFFFDFCYFNICSLPVANRGAMISFHGATKTFDILL